ncbi:MAG TPA: COX15/CtaA family protein, partial [Acidimicrobiales bacterium]|nr:COX15/CtaA family protein [Acidimicrobiales bacterium]
RLPSTSPRAYLRVTLAAQFLLGFIIVSGAAVRLTGSGLGCTDWPTCEDGSIVAPLEFHPMVEFGNRLVTGAVSAIVILAVLGSLARVPRRRDLVRLSLGLVAGVLGQIVLGGLTVLFHLAPPLVMSHFLLSMVILWCAVVLHHRAGLPDDAAGTVALAAPSVSQLGRAVAVAAAVVVLSGTIVTGTGPHPGAHEGELIERLPFSLHDVARLHGALVVAFCGLVLLTIVRLVRTGAAPSAVRRAEVLLAVLVAQAAIGYTQYFIGVPALLVGFHVAGAVLVWVAALRFALGLRGAVAPAEAAEPAVLVAG